MEPRPITTVDVVLLTLSADQLTVALTLRSAEPFKGLLALPGGYVHVDQDQDALQAARRVLAEKTGIKAPYLEQLYSFAGAARDPRGWSVSISYYALIPLPALEAAIPGALSLVAVDEVGQLPFDHSQIVAAAVRRVRDKSSYSSLPCYLLPSRFTLAELQSTYEQVMGEKLDKSSFRRKLSELDFLEPVRGELKSGAHRPAQLYRVRKARSLVVFDKTM
jgi:ADP-ribose pyrophosphatase YjhB (NUDIX family)